MRDSRSKSRIERVHIDADLNGRIEGKNTPLPPIGSTPNRDGNLNGEAHAVSADGNAIGNCPTPGSASATGVQRIGKEKRKPTASMSRRWQKTGPPLHPRRSSVPSFGRQRPHRRGRKRCGGNISAAPTAKTSTAGVQTRPWSNVSLQPESAEASEKSAARRNEEFSSQGIPAGPWFGGLNGDATLVRCFGLGPMDTPSKLNRRPNAIIIEPRRGYRPTKRQPSHGAFAAGHAVAPGCCQEMRGSFNHAGKRT